MPAVASATGVQLDGADDYVEAGLDPTAAENSTARTWEAWVKTDSTATTQNVINRYYNAGGTEPWVFELSNGVPLIFVQKSSGGGTGFGERKADRAVNDGEWHHVAAIWVPGQRLDVYIDGEPANGPLRGSILGANDAGAEIPIWIGASHYAPVGRTFYFDGSIDSVHYSLGARYDTDESFTPATCPAVDADTIGLWNFDEGSGTTTQPSGQITTPATLESGASFGDGFDCSAGGDALRFDGDGDRLDAGADPSAAATTTARTWEAWVKTESNERQTIIGRTPETGEAPWVLDMEDGIARIHVQSGTAHGARYASATINDGEWHHLAAVWVPGERLDLYLDGTRSNGPLGGGGVPTAIAAAGGAPIRVGAGFDGDLDSVRYSKTARYDADFDPAECWNVDAYTVALWTFDEGEGDTTETKGQLTADADLVGDTRWVTGVGCDLPPVEGGGSAVLLDGTDDYVDAGLDPTASQNSTARTWEAWVKTDSTATTQNIINRYINAGGTEPFVFELSNGVPLIWIQGGGWGERKADRAVNDGEWHHVAAVWEPGTRLDVYIDGEPANGPLRGSILSSNDVGADVPIWIGASHYAPVGRTFYFNGAIDGVRYTLGTRYTGSFTPEIHPAADSTTIGVWNFDEGIGTTTAAAGQITAAASLLDGASWTDGPTP